MYTFLDSFDEMQAEELFYGGYVITNSHEERMLDFEELTALLESAFSFLED